MNPSKPVRSTQSPRIAQIAQSIVLLALFSTPALVYLHGANVSDADIWWHLRTGEWIQQHHAVLFTDPFSRPGAGKPWAAYSWLFELIVFQLFQALGLVGITVYTAAMIATITAALFHLIKRVQQDFTVSILLTMVTAYSLGRLFAPRPWLFSILFFILQLDILQYARKTGRRRVLLWLPLIYVFWANTHIQFIDGLLVLVLAVLESAIARRRGKDQADPGSNLGFNWIACLLAASLLATLINPYGWGIYKVAWDLATQPGVLGNIAELQAIPFRAAPDFLMLFLALLGVGALGWGRKLPIFETGLLIFGALISFRTGRDMWIMAIVASAILAAGLKVNSRAQQAKPLPLFAYPVIAFALALSLFAGIRAMHIDNTALAKQLAENMPVKAVQAIKARGLTGQLYNNYDWGGYLIWSLREPVSIDGRASLSGDESIERHFSTWNAQPGWNSDPDLKDAALVIAPVKAPLTQLLRVDPQYSIAYEDKVAVVFLARDR